jgi:Tripartite tricarboxylate transporter TctA family
MESIVGELGFMATSAGKAFVTLMEPHRLMFLGLGCIMGLVLGIIPGIGGLTGTAMLLPFTFNMDPYSAFALLLGLGATTATGDPIPEVPPPQQRCSMATRWRNGVRPAGHSAPPTCHP